MKAIVLTNQRFGRLLVLKRVPAKEVTFQCRCDCGKLHITRGINLRDGSTKSCGCYNLECLSKRERKPQSRERRIAKFWSLVVKNGPDSCWNWIGSIDSTGYGGIGFNSQKWHTHRFSWMIHNGPIENGLHVLHRCDNKRCVNPKHLFLGTNLDNIRDKVAKGRSPKNLPGACKIDAEMVLKIREMWVPYKFGIIKIAKQLGLHKKTVETAIYKRKGVISCRA